MHLNYVMKHSPGFCTICAVVFLCFIQGVLLADDSYSKLHSLIQIGESPQSVISSVGPLLTFQPFEETISADATNIKDGELYGFKSKLGEIDISGGVIFVGGSVVFWGIGFVSKDLSLSEFGKIVTPFKQTLGRPDSFDVATCTSFKLPVDVPVATWKRGDITYAVAWLIGTETPSWIEFKVVKDGFLESEHPLFPIQPVSAEERLSITRDGRNQFESVTQSGTSER